MMKQTHDDDGLSKESRMISRRGWCSVTSPDVLVMESKVKDASDYIVQCEISIRPKLASQLAGCHPLFEYNLSKPCPSLNSIARYDGRPAGLEAERGLGYHSALYLMQYNSESQSEALFSASSPPKPNFSRPSRRSR